MPQRWTPACPALPKPLQRSKRGPGWAVDCCLRSRKRRTQTQAAQSSKTQALACAAGNTRKQ
eukprot:1158867-Pelagomonas_calceolata.AAC.20